MFPAFLITMREVIEASLVVAAILGILTKLNQKHAVKKAWMAVGAATIASIFLLGVGSFLGVKVHDLYERYEPVIEGVLMAVSALFITWAVFFLHDYFMNQKVHLLHKIKSTVEQNEERGVFILIFFAVFREGFEIVLFLSTIYLSSNPQHIFLGFAWGVFAGLFVSLVLFRSTMRMSVQHAIKATSILMIVFASGLLARGIHEFAEVGLIPEIGKMTLAFIPQKETFVGAMLKSIVGVTRQMDIVQISVYILYALAMSWYVFFRKKRKTPLT